MVDHKIKEGITVVYTKDTNSNDAHSSSNTGALDYLVSTPAIVTMIIDASTEMLDELLPADYLTVGKRIELQHEQPSLVGETITLKLTVDQVEGNKIVLDVQVSDSKGVVCAGKYERAIIGQGKLLEIAYRRSPELL